MIITLQSNILVKISWFISTFSLLISMVSQLMMQKYLLALLFLIMSCCVSFLTWQLLFSLNRINVNIRRSKFWPQYQTAMAEILVQPIGTNVCFYYFRKTPLYSGVKEKSTLWLKTDKGWENLSKHSVISDRAFCSIIAPAFQYDIKEYTIQRPDDSLLKIVL